MADVTSRSDADGVATLTLLLPAFTAELRTELTQHLRDVADDETVRAVVLTGTGRAFCVGQDLGAHVQALRTDPGTSLNLVADSYNPMVQALTAVPVPVVVGINGACAGAGLGLVLGADLRVAAAGAKFTTAFAGVGLGSDSGLAWRLVQCVGMSRATELLLLPDPFTAETAASWGMVHRVVAAADVLAETTALATRLAQGPTAAYRAIKTVLSTAAADTLTDTLATEARLQSALGGTADHREAVESFLAKRKPVFTGR